MSQLKVYNKNRFGIVPDAVLENRNLTLETRAVAAWLCGRQDGFEIRVEVMRERFLGIGDKRWKAVRGELESIGWWRSTRAKTGERGRFVWTHEFSLDGFGPTPTATAEGDSSIPPSGRDGGGTHARGGDNHKDVHQQDVNHHPKHLLGGGGETKGKTPEPQVSKEEADLEDLVLAAFWQASAAGTINNPAGWRAKVRRRLMDEGASADDLATLKKWQEAKADAERREKEAAARAEAQRLALERAEEARQSGRSRAGLADCLSIVKRRA